MDATLGTPIDERLKAELGELTLSMCKALNDPKRLLILYVLGEAPRSVTEITELIDAPQANTSQHLAVLRQRGLVDAERQGNNVIYSLRHTKVIDAVDLLREIMGDEIERRGGLVAE